ncbi:hypothetical protein KQH50_02205 [bacterium]|nr:hypothetical protein [bacterium]
MDPIILATLISSGTSLLTATIFYFLVQLFLQRIEGNIQKDLARLDPSFHPFFKENREYIKLIRKIKHDFIEFYFTTPRKGVMHLNTLERIVDDTREKYTDIFFIDDEVLLWFSSLREEHTGFFAIYRAHLNLGDVSKFIYTIRDQINEFYDQVPLIHPKIKETGDLFIDYVVNFNQSSELKHFINRLDEIDGDAIEFFDEVDPFMNETIDKLDGLISLIEDIFLAQYVEIPS